MKSRYGSLKKGKNGAVVNDILSILTFSIAPQEWAVTATTTTPRVNSQHIAIQIAFECERRNQIVSVTHRAGQESKQEKKHPTPQMQKNSDESLDFYATGIYLLRRHLDDRARRIRLGILLDRFSKLQCRKLVVVADKEFRMWFFFLGRRETKL